VFDFKALVQLMEASEKLSAWRFVLLAAIGWLFGLAALIVAIRWW